ncbi:MAG: STAS domain-containing protein [Pseudomonadota bacterium]
MLQEFTRDGRTIFTVTLSRLDAGLAAHLKAEFERLLPDAAEEIVIDLGQVGSIDSAGLGALVSCYKLARPERQLSLTSLNPTVQRVFRLTRMDRLIPIEQGQTV